MKMLGSSKTLAFGIFVVISAVLVGCVPQKTPTIMNVDQTQLPPKTQLQTSSTSNQSTSNCSKTEVMKLINKGFSKTEINDICGTTTTQEQSTEVKNSPVVWITPADSTCKNYGGKLWAGPWPMSIGPKACVANYEKAKNICSASGGRIPTYEELRNVVIIECGGISNPNYKACYREKGFFPKEENYYPNAYWSSSIGKSSSNGLKVAKSLSFKDAKVYNNYRTTGLYVRCVNDEK